MSATALILAAGRGARFSAAGGEGPKLLAQWRGKPLVRHVAEAALASAARPVIVVTGHARAEVEAALAGFALTFVHNGAFTEGLAGSLALGLGALPAQAESAVILLADMPLVSAALIDGLTAALAAKPGALASAPVRNGARGNPVVLGRALFAQAAALTGDQGARRLIDALGGALAEVPVADDAAAMDVDTPAALADLLRRD